MGRGYVRRGRVTRYASLYERLIANTAEPLNDRACWLWTGRVHNHRPVLTVRRKGKPTPVHAARLMLEVFYVMTPELEASHLCPDSWLCINPDHLKPETKKQNMARRWGQPLPAGVDFALQHQPCETTIVAIDGIRQGWQDAPHECDCHLLEKRNGFACAAEHP